MKMYVETESGKQGPFDSNEILAKIGSGSLRPSDEIWIEGTASTFPACELLPVSAFGTADSRTSDRIVAPARHREPIRRLPQAMRRQTNGISTAMFIVVGVFVFGLFGAIALFCAPLILYASFQSAARHNQENLAEFKNVKASIIAYVEDHPDAGELAWADLEDAGLVDRHDRALCKKVGAQYYPFSAKSADDTTVFTIKSDFAEKRFQKDFRFGLAWPSPDERFEVVKTSRSETSMAGELTLSNNRTGEVLLRFNTDAATDAQWLYDGSIVAIEERFPSSKSQVSVYSLAGDRLQKFKLPDGIHPRLLLPEYEKSLPHDWIDERIELDSWRNDLLKLDVNGSVWIKKGEAFAGRANFRVRFTIRFDASGEGSIVKSEEVFRCRIGTDGYAVDKFDI